ncbi:penicillin-binding protein 2 [candidate division WWE3 bacterium]|nr:penicillin-binding protein 2 [candidate division WWE3 bacterium]
MKKRVVAIDLRINFLIILVFFVVLIVFVRLFYIQILGHDRYVAMAESQYQSSQEIPAERGEILSSDGFSLAANQKSYLLYAQPKVISDILQTANDLARIIIGTEDSDVFEEYKDRFYDTLNLDLFWVTLKHNLSLEQKEAVEKAGIDGIGFDDESIRYYPEGTLASHVLGFVAGDEKGVRRGYYGVEGGYDGDLRGKPGRILEEKDASGDPILLGGYRRIDPINGRDIVLTIDRSVQYIVEKRLEEGVKAYDALSGSVVVMDPFTGDVLAMANYPTFNPGEFDDKESTAAVVERRNPAISDSYEPGSVVKALTISAAVDLGLVSPDSTFVDSGPVDYSGYTIDSWDGKHHGVQTIIQLLQKSNNIGAAWVGHLVGAKALSKYFRDFGLGEATHIGLEGEDTGIIREYSEWTDIDLATVSFGQGISATPLQVLNAFNVIANGGLLMRPRVVSKLYDNGKVIELPKKALSRVISKETSEVMTDLLTKAVEGGESKFFNIKGYKVAGKTGTAQIPFEGRYDPTKTNATFVGFLPTSKRFSMIVRLSQPGTSPFASETAVPLWMRIAEGLVRYYGVLPDD